MASERDSFVFYRSFWTSLSELDKEEQFLFFKSICEYVFCGIVPEWKSGLERAFWNDFKDRLDRDANRWEQTKIARSEAGKKGGAPKGNHNAIKQAKQANACTEEETSKSLNKQANACKNNQKQAKQAVNVNVNVNDNVNVNNIDDDEDEETTATNFIGIDKFVGLWNDVGSGQVLTGEVKTLKLINTDKFRNVGVDLPTDAQQRLNTLCGNVAKLIKERGAIEIAKNIHKDLPTDFDYNNPKHLRPFVANVIAVVIIKLSKVKMKPKATNFGSFQWFTDFKNFKKLLDGEIQ